MSDRVLRAVGAGLVIALLTQCMLSSLAEAIFIRGHNLPGWQSILLGSFMIGVSIVAGIKYALTFDKTWHKPDRTRCQKCGYMLKGLTSSRCPECGTNFKPKQAPREVTPPADSKDA